MPLPAFTSRVESLLHSALVLLELLAVFCGLAVFAFAALSLLVTTYRVAIRGRVLALLRALPGVAARRTLRGSISPAPGGALLAVEYHERSLLRPSRRRARQLATVTGDDWLAAIEDAGYRLARERVYLQRDRRGS